MKSGNMFVLIWEKMKNGERFCSDQKLDDLINDYIDRFCFPEETIADFFDFDKFCDNFELNSIDPRHIGSAFSIKDAIRFLELCEEIQEKRREWK